MIPARLRGARDPCQYDRLPLLSMRAMLPGHENLLKAVDGLGGERTADVRRVALPGFHARGNARCNGTDYPQSATYP